MKDSPIPISTTLFIAICAMTMSSIALVVDTIMPALNVIASDFELSNPNARQWTISVVFIGMGLGQIPFGIWSDHSGRKPPIVASLVVLIIASVVAALAKSFEILIVARFIQGVAGAGPRTIVVALVRDLFRDAEMARIMSLIYAVFIGVPMIAPVIGQWILDLSGWPYIFGFFVVFFTVNGWLIWHYLPETLALERRRPLGLQHAKFSATEVLRQRSTLLHLAAITLTFGSFTAYLLSAQQILQNAYATGDLFAYVFASIAFVYGLASYSNSKLVQHVDLRKLNLVSVLFIIICSLVMIAFSSAHDGLPPLWAFMLWACSIFIPIAILFSNTNALAMAPLGHVAGMGAAIIGTVSTLASGVIGAWIGSLHNGTVVPLVTSFIVTGLLALVLLVIEYKDYLRMRTASAVEQP